MKAGPLLVALVVINATYGGEHTVARGMTWGECHAWQARLDVSDYSNGVQLIECRREPGDPREA